MAGRKQTSLHDFYRKPKQTATTNDEEPIRVAPPGNIVTEDKGTIRLARPKDARSEQESKKRKREPFQLIKNGENVGDDAASDTRSDDEDKVSDPPSLTPEASQRRSLEHVLSKSSPITFLLLELRRFTFLFVICLIGSPQRLFHQYLQS